MQVVKTSTSTGDHIRLAETQITIFFFQVLVMAAAIRRAMDVLSIRVQTRTASYVGLRRYLPKLQSHQEAVIQLVLPEVADWLQHPLSLV